MLINSFSYYADDTSPDPIIPVAKLRSFRLKVETTT